MWSRVGIVYKVNLIRPFPPFSLFSVPSTILAYLYHYPPSDPIPPANKKWVYPDSLNKPWWIIKTLIQCQLFLQNTLLVPSPPTLPLSSPPLPTPTTGGRIGNYALFRLIELRASSDIAPFIALLFHSVLPPWLRFKSVLNITLSGEKLTPLSL